MLRVISGSAKGHKLKTINGMTTRPTSDKVKGSIFNILASHIPGAAVLDVFGGTGSLGIEALSRGAESAVFFDKSTECCGVIRENLAHTKLTEQARVFHTDYAAGIAKMHAEGKKFDIIFLDPPYHKNFIQETLKILVNNDIIGDDGILIAEHSSSDILPEAFGNLVAVDSRKYGDTTVTFYRKDSSQ